jgi:hypothetical protein
LALEGSVAVLELYVGWVLPEVFFGSAGFEAVVSD